MARIIFPVMGSENVSVEVLSSALKRAGHQVEVAFDRALFNDKMYFPSHFLARLFDYKDKVVERIVDYQPDLVAFSVIVDSYQWSLYIARRVKERLNVPILFGGIHPTSLPEMVINEDSVNIICLGEGEVAIVELANSIDRGEMDYNIKNLWFKRDGRIIRNEVRPLVSNLDEIPIPDKDLFKGVWDIRDYYLTVTNRGCIYTCSYCMENFKVRWERSKGQFIRERSVDAVIQEINRAKGLYGIKRVDIKNNILSASEGWTLSFLQRYKDEIGLPLRIMGHPRLMTQKVCRALKEAGCWHIQIGIQSLDPKVRRILGRYESNEEIFNALENMERAGLRYSIDLMFGLPGQGEEYLIDAAMSFTKLKNLVRISVFWLEYLPEVDITAYAFKEGLIDEKILKDIYEGRQENYLSTGWVMDKRLMRDLKNYQLVFRIIPITPEVVIRFILYTKIYKLFRFLPQTIIITLVDILVSIIKLDHYALYAIKSYLLEILNRITGKTFERINDPERGGFFERFNRLIFKTH